MSVARSESGSYAGICRIGRLGSSCCLVGGAGTLGKVFQISSCRMSEYVMWSMLLFESVSFNAFSSFVGSLSSSMIFS